MSDLNKAEKQFTMSFEELGERELRGKDIGTYINLETQKIEYADYSGAAIREEDFDAAKEFAQDYLKFLDDELTEDSKYYALFSKFAAISEDTSTEYLQTLLNIKFAAEVIMSDEHDSRKCHDSCFANAINLVDAYKKSLELKQVQSLGQDSDAPKNKKKVSFATDVDGNLKEDIYTFDKSDAAIPPEKVTSEDLASSKPSVIPHPPATAPAKISPRRPHKETVLNKEQEGVVNKFKKFQALKKEAAEHDAEGAVEKSTIASQMDAKINHKFKTSIVDVWRFAKEIQPHCDANSELLKIVDIVLNTNGNDVYYDDFDLRYPEGTYTEAIKTLDASLHYMQQMKAKGLVDTADFSKSYIGELHGIVRDKPDLIPEPPKIKKKRDRSMSLPGPGEEVVSSFLPPVVAVPAITDPDGKATSTTHAKDNSVDASPLLPTVAPQGPNGGGGKKKKKK